MRESKVQELYIFTILFMTSLNDGLQLHDDIPVSLVRQRLDGTGCGDTRVRVHGLCDMAGCNMKTTSRREHDKMGAQNKEKKENLEQEKTLLIGLIREANGNQKRKLANRLEVVETELLQY